MDRETQERFRAAVLDRIKVFEAEIASMVDDTKAAAPETSVEDLSGAEALRIQQIALASQRRLQQELSRLHEALIRIDRGTYGLCLRCGNDNDVERLKIQPDAMTCVPCARSDR